MSAAIEGVVEEVLVDRGDLVEEGQVIARLESSVERAGVEVAQARARARGQILSNEARLVYAKKTLTRQTRLEQQEIVSESDMDQALSAKAIAEADLSVAREARQIAELELKRSRAALERRTIHSPVKGVVVQRVLSPGEYADPPNIMKLAQIDPLRVEVFAPLQIYGKIAVGMDAEVLPEAPLGGNHTATVTVVDRVIDAASGTFGVRLELPNPDYALPAGLKCRVRFPVEGDGTTTPLP